MGNKKNKVVDLKPEAISKDQLERVQNIVSAVNKLHADIGKIEAQKHNLLHTLAQGNDQLNEVQEEIRKEYGEVNINIQDGSYRIQR